jgi:hypothetical protein
MLLTRHEVRRGFWLLIQAGVLREDAAVSIGADPATGGRWFSQAGGVIPTHVLKPPSDRYLSLAEREEIFAGVERGESIRLIARQLERAPSTVLRELRRNMWHQLYRGRFRLKRMPRASGAPDPGSIAPAWPS